MGKELDIYQTLPIKYEDKIPVFSSSDGYIKNYEKISKDHLKALENTGHNPFMKEEHWIEVEDSTVELVNKYTKQFEKDFKILDVGVGLGRLLERINTQEKYGLDISFDYLKQAKIKGIEVCLAKIEDMPYKEDLFDCVVCTDVLEHVFDLNDSIQKILKVLKEDGVLIIRVPYKEDLSHYLSDECPYELVHLRNFDEYNLELLFKKIFRCTVLEHTLSGYYSGRLKIFNDYKHIKHLIKITMNSSFFSKFNFIDKLKKMTTNPSEINVVIKK